MEEVQPEIDERGGQGAAVPHQMFLGQVPAAGTQHDRRGPIGAWCVIGADGPGLVVPVALGEIQLPADRVVQVELAADDVFPGGSGGILQIGHPHRGGRIDRIDGHLARRRSGDLAIPRAEPRRRRRHGPVGFPDERGISPEVELGALGNVPVSSVPGAEQFGPPTGEGRVQRGHEIQRGGREDFVEPR